MRVMCTSTATPVSKGTALGLLEDAAAAKSASFRTGEAVGHLVGDDDGYVFGAGKIAE
jgi:hypothetical protein